MTSQAHAGKRPVCPDCLRPQQTCICRWITPTEHAVEVLILQHPLEVAHAKGSARLLHLSLPRSRMVVGETFEEPVLRKLLYAPFPHRQDCGARSAQPILLYPATPGSAEPPILDEAALREPENIRLVILDGTWRKSRKMLYSNPLLQQLPRLPLLQMPASRYAIRKAHAPDQLSTLEACCHALIQLERNEERYRPLLEAFNGFVVQQSGYASAYKQQGDKRGQKAG